MGAAFGGGDGVAVGMDLAVAAIPGHGPFERAVAAGLFGAAGEDLAGDGEVLPASPQIILEAPGKWKTAFSGTSDLRSAARDRRPSGFPRRRRDRPWSATCGTGGPDRSARSRRRSAGRGESAPACRAGSARRRLPPARPAAGRGRSAGGTACGCAPLHFEHVRERVDDGDADAVQAAGGLVGLAVELAAGMQHGQHHFERRLAREISDGSRPECRGHCR